MAGINHSGSLNYSGTGTEMKSLKIAGNNVTDITRDTAQVGCTKVTRAEAEALLAEMNKAPEQFDFKITSHITDADYVSFYINEKGTGWAGASTKVGAGYYNAEGFGNLQSLSLCLSKPKAEKLMRFLAEQLKLTVESKNETYVIEYYEGGVDCWRRSGNRIASGTFTSLPHAATAIAKVREEFPGYQYRTRAI